MKATLPAALVQACTLVECPNITVTSHPREFARPPALSAWTTIAAACCGDFAGSGRISPIPAGYARHTRCACDASRQAMARRDDELLPARLARSSVRMSAEPILKYSLQQQFGLALGGAGGHRPSGHVIPSSSKRGEELVSMPVRGPADQTRSSSSPIAVTSRCMSGWAEACSASATIKTVRVCSRTAE